MATINAQFGIRFNGLCNTANKEAWKADLDTIVAAVETIGGGVRIEITWDSADNSGLSSDAVFDYFKSRVIANERVIIGVERRQ